MGRRQEFKSSGKECHSPKNATASRICTSHDVGYNADYAKEHFVNALPGPLYIRKENSTAAIQPLRCGRRQREKYQIRRGNKEMKGAEHTNARERPSF